MTAEAILDIPRTPEQPMLHPIDAAINTSVNHPVRMLLLLIMARQPGVPFSGIDLLHELNAAQGADKGWELEHSEALAGQCLTGLVPANLVHETKKIGSSGDTVKAFQVADDGLEWGVPLFGALLDLELRSAFSSQRTFGKINTSTKDAGALEMRSPMVRLRILEEIYHASDRPVNQGYLRNVIPRHRGAVDFAIEELTGEGIVRVRHKTNPADRVVSLLPSGPTPDRYRSQMRPEIRAAYDASIALYRRGYREVDGGLLLDEMELFLPGTDRNRLWRAISDNQFLKFMTFADEALFGGNKGRTAPRTRIEITNEYDAIIGELVRSIGALRHSGDYRKVAAAQAMQILSDEGAVAYLMGKARANSKLTRYDADAAMVRMHRLAGRLVGWVSLQRLLTFDADWRDDAACRDEDPEVFFGLKETMTEAEAEKARKVCADCISRLHCLKWAVEQPEIYGMWGGHTETERRNLPKGTQTLLGTIKLAG